MMSDWDDIRFFLASMREGSLTAAAAALQVQQSTVSRRVKALEDRLGQPLFERAQGGLTPTPLARAWLDAALRMEQLHLELEALAQAQGQPEPQGLCRITTTEPLARAVLLDQLTRWRERYPRIDLELHTGHQSLDMTRREAELALRFARPTRGDLSARRLRLMPRALLASRALLARWPQRPLRELPWIVFDLPEHPTPEQLWHARHIQAPPLLKTSSYTLLIEAIERGLGVGIAARATRSDRLVELDVPPDWPLPEPMELWLVTHRALRDLPHVSVIWDELVALLAQPHSTTSSSSDT